MQSYIAYTYHWVNLSRLTAQFRREKWFNIGSNRSIVIRYRFDSQFHCSYLESRGVPGKTREIPVQKRGKLSPFHFRFPVRDFQFRWRHFRWRHFRWRHIRWCNFRWRHIQWCNFRWRHCSTSNDKWMVPLYY